ncbi:MAG TPA: ABC transporter substrate-binding protein [Beijerinckiaceae bacterium]
MHSRHIARPLGAALVLGFGLWAQGAQADITIGVSLSTTGPAAALGIPERNMVALWPTEIAGEKLKVIVLDDEGDPTKATTNARRFVTDDRADIIMGSSTTPPSNAIGAVALETGTPHFALGPVAIPPDRMKWTFVMPQDVALMADVIFKHMKANKVQTVGMIGFSDSWGDLWLAQFKKLAEPAGLKLVANERYGRADTSVTGQALKVVSARPDAVLVAASGTGAALPQTALRERGYQGAIYQTHGAVTKDFIRIAGKAAEGAILASGPAILAEKLPESSPVRKESMAYVQAYEGKYGPDTRTQFAAHTYDAFKILERVVPAALKKAKPGTKEFRDALLAALESEKDIVASQGVYNFTSTDHYGLDERGRVLIRVKNGDWEVIP